MRGPKDLAHPSAARCSLSPGMDAPRRINFHRAARVNDIRQSPRLFALIPIDVHRMRRALGFAFRRVDLVDSIAPAQGDANRTGAGA
jgi:hypothetical protein